MMPLIDVVAIDQAATCAEAMHLATTESHNLIPVFSDRIDRIVGILDALELLGEDLSQSIKPYVKAVNYAPGTKSIQNLLVDMRKASDEIVVIVDEFGGAEGIVSIEDILEEVVEDIQDEYDSGEAVSQWIRKLGKREYIVSARVPIDDLTEKLNIELPQGRYASLAGFLLDKAKEVPQVGTAVKYKKITFMIQRGTPQAIEEVRVSW
jgi:putative hemolysin